MFFQNSVIKKYLASQDAELIAKAWETYKAYFLNPAVQENIRASKEEQFQEGFLRELFVKVFGYTLNPMPDFNLITEQKNETDAKKADGAILRDGKVIGVIELKDHKTTDLSHVERQAFGYKSQHKDTKYVVISNFEKLRFYIDNAVEHIEWNLFTINQEQFRLLYFCLSWANIQADKPLQAKQDSVSNEDEVTQKLYKDYSAFKREIFADILAHNTTEATPKEHILLLFKKTQKLLDRLLFIFFAEDSGLLPPNSMVEILNQWEQLKEMDEYVPLYNRIKKYFGYMNTGWQGKKYEIFAYNGGLFKPDEVLDGLTISDELLARFTRKLADYDYSTDVDVNILGHIFENSLNEIEEITAQINDGQLPSLQGGDGGRLVSKRKRDGVFYTPQYITKYIVENTVGKLCAEKKSEMGIDEQEYFSDKNRQTATKKRLLDQLTAYREWLLGITICDPACGSGAFLNAALQFLMAEHKLIDEMEAKLTGSELIFPNIENSILENNLYGVDINEESVEIARLALWLRTAKPHRKLSSLNNNIKCGNSLISDPEIAGEKAFNWQAEFPQVFAKGGFDVVIGNPPYVNMVNILDENQRKYYQKNYKTVKNKSDLYSIFTEKASKLIRENGLFGFIFPNSWMGTESFSSFREFLAHDVKVTKLVQLPPGVFEDATVTTVLCFYTNCKPTEKDNIIIETCENKEFVSKGFILPYKQVLENPNTSFSFEKTIKIDKVPTKKLSEVASFSLGIKTSDDKRFVFEEKKDDDCYLFLRGRNVKRWNTPENDEWLWYKPELICEKPGGRPRVFENFVVDKKIIIQDIATEITATLDTNKYLCNDTLNIIFELDKQYTFEYILILLNSKLINVWFKKVFPAGLHIKANQLEQIPIPECTDQQPFIDLADKMLSLNRDLQAKRARFIRRLQDNMPDIKITGTLESFDTLDFAGFVAELKKQKIKLSLVQQDEWEEYFSQYKTACTELTSAISATDAEIDARVYDLYGLTDDERQLIANM